MGKGKEKGAVWVARRVPDGYIGGHANQARITTFPHHDPEDTRFSKDLVPWAKRAGYYPAAAAAEAFDFSAMANPISFHGARYGEVRVWDFFRRFLPSVELDYLQYVKGFELKARMPLWVKPTQKVSLATPPYYSPPPYYLPPHLTTRHHLPYYSPPPTLLLATLLQVTLNAAPPYNHR